jgi:hypothetical protein
MTASQPWRIHSINKRKSEVVWYQIILSSILSQPILTYFMPLISFLSCINARTDALNQSKPGRFVAFQATIAAIPGPDLIQQLAVASWPMRQFSWLFGLVMSLPPMPEQ